MITVKVKNVSQYIVTMDAAERATVGKVAAAFSITRADAFAAVINRGLTSINQQVDDIQKHHRDVANGEHY